VGGLAAKRLFVSCNWTPGMKLKTMLVLYQKCTFEHITGKNFPVTGLPLETLALTGLQGGDARTAAALLHPVMKLCRARRAVEWVIAQRQTPTTWWTTWWTRKTPRSDDQSDELWWSDETTDVAGNQIWTHDDDTDAEKCSAIETTQNDQSYYDRCFIKHKQQPTLYTQLTDVGDKLKVKSAIMLISD